MTGNCWLGLTDDMPLEVDTLMRATAARSKVGLSHLRIANLFQLDDFYLAPLKFDLPDSGRCLLKLSTLWGGWI